MNKVHVLNTLKIIKLMLCSYLIVSCGKTAITPDGTNISDLTLTPSPQATPINPAPENTPSVNLEVYDSRMLFEVIKKDTLCHSINEPFQLNLVFTNLTDINLNLANQFVIARGRHGNGGNIIPQMSLNGKEIYTIWDNSTLNIPLPTVDDYFTIAPSQVFDKIVNFYFPKDLLESLPVKQEIVVTPSPGKYMITFSFYHTDQSTQNWSGIIKSDPIEICLK
jgi:hypothetical protein